MTDINEARKRLERYADRGDEGVNGDIAIVLDALDAAERERDAFAAVIEQVRANLSNAPECDEHPDGDAITCGWKSDMARVRKALESAPVDVLRRVKAEAWDEAIEEQRLLGPANEADIPQNPYRIEKGQQ